MADDRMMQFRVGIMVLAALIVAAVLVVWFGEVPHAFEQYYTVHIHFDYAPGVEENTPIRKSGMTIGRVRSVEFDEQRGGVSVVAEIREHRLRRDSRPRAYRSLLGDAAIEFLPGSAATYLEEGARIEGEIAPGITQVAQNLEQRLAVALESITATTQEWQGVGQRMNRLLEANEEKLTAALDRAVVTLEGFNRTMQDIDAVVGDPATQQRLREAFRELPELTSSTRDAVSAFHDAVAKADRNLDNLQRATGPLADQTGELFAKLDSGADKMNVLLAELSSFARQMRSEQSSLYQLSTNADLYNNLEEAARSLRIVLTTLQPAARDLRIFADKIARHPELIGIRGYMKGSSGLK